MIVTPQLAKPFLKWAGGKNQILANLIQSLPSNLSNSSFTYIEPFVGSGALLFWILNHCPKVKKIVINDINEDLINTYRVIASHPKQLIKILQTLENQFHTLEKEEQKKEYYYEKRTIYNLRKGSASMRAALFIFLNRTCFNGLYRVNRKNEFNVPIGSYKKPRICDKENLLNASIALQKAVILCGDYQATLKYVDKNTLYYFDPPYKPLSDTSSFNSYSQEAFNDQEQIRLRDFCIKLNKLKITWLLSNSDVKTNNQKNSFFDTIYSPFHIQRIEARRSINSNAKKRGHLTELLITNQSLL